MNNITIAFIMTCIAGASTIIGTFFIFGKKDTDKLTKFALAFAAGVMISVSITDLIPEGMELMIIDNVQVIAFSLAILFILVGIVISELIDRLLPETNKKNYDKKLYKLGLFSMLAIIAHNIPEGIATFLSSSTNITLGISLTVAIALHNIPEGISISVPIYKATGSRKKAFGMTLISALAEPFGAVLAILFLKPIITDSIMGSILLIIAGIMIHIGAKQLLPTALKYKGRGQTIGFFITGFIIMVINHCLFHVH